MKNYTLGYGNRRYLTCAPALAVSTFATSLAIVATVIRFGECGSSCSEIPGTFFTDSALWPFFLPLLDAQTQTFLALFFALSIKKTLHLVRTVRYSIAAYQIPLCPRAHDLTVFNYLEYRLG